MKTIKFNSLTLSYFKGVKSLTINFNDGITNIYGCNGSGKSTICDAVQWVLFGKSSSGDTKFGIKTRDADGNVIPDVEHSVTLSLSIDGVKRDVKRQWVEEKVIRRGVQSDEVKHHAEYYIDGMVYTKRDFDQFISDIVNESTFRAITSPSYFLSLKWQEQRAFLEQIANVDYSSIENDKRFDAITHQTDFKTFEEYLQHITYNIRTVKDALEVIPARIEEQNNTCPEQLDWDVLSVKADELSAEIKEKQDMLVSLRQAPESASRKLIREKIEFQQSRIDNMKESARRLSNEESSAYSNKQNEYNQKVQEFNQLISGLKIKLQSNKTLLDHAEQSIRDLNKERENSSAQWKEISASKFVAPTEAVCPLCHRPFDGDDYSKEIAKLKEEFNISKAEKLAKLKTKAQTIKEDTATAESQIKAYATLIEETTNEIAETEKSLNALKQEFANIKMPKSTEVLLSENPNYHQAIDKLHELEDALANDVVTDNTEAINSIQAQINERNNELNVLREQLASRNLYNIHQERIAQLREESERLNIQLDTLNEKKDVALLYQESRDQLLEDSVNTQFSYVKFRLFETLNDGSRKPNCEAWVNGVPYSDLNSASQMNAGRDIINAISAYYQVSAPIMQDNSEAVNEFLPVHTQEIRLSVSTDNILTIK